MKSDRIPTYAAIVVGGIIVFVLVLRWFFVYIGVDPTSFSR